MLIKGLERYIIRWQILLFYLTQATQVMINKLQSLKRKTKIKFYQTLNVFYDEMNIRRQSGKFQFQEDPFSKNVEGIGKFLSRSIIVNEFFTN